MRDGYTGLDQFGQVVDQNWVNPSTGVSTDRFQYGYDRNGNVLYKNNLLGSGFSELYHANSSSSGDYNSAYDPLNRLSSFRRGTLSPSTNNGSGMLDTVSTLSTAPGSSQSWGLDALGNWSSSPLTGSARTTNSRNQLTQIGSSESLTYDNNGSLTADGTSYYGYDAWGNDMGCWCTSGYAYTGYGYDALGRRITTSVYNPSTGTTTPHDLYYSKDWQVVEESTPGGPASYDQKLWTAPRQLKRLF